MSGRSPDQHSERSDSGARASGASQSARRRAERADRIASGAIAERGRAERAIRHEGERSEPIGVTRELGDSCEMEAARRAKPGGQSTASSRAKRASARAER